MPRLTPGHYLGFALQPVRVLYHLLIALGGAKVSLRLSDGAGWLS